MFNWRVASPNTLRSYESAVKDFETVTGVRVDKADAVTIASWRSSMEARGLSLNTIRSRLSAVSIVSGVKVKLPKKQTRADIPILNDDQIKIFFRQIQKDSDRQLMVTIILTGRRPTTQYHWLSLPNNTLTTQEITRKIKRYARLAGLREEQVNMRTLIRTGRELTAKYGAKDLVEHILPKSTKPTVEWKPLHGIGRRNRHSVTA